MANISGMPVTSHDRHIMRVVSCDMFHIVISNSNSAKPLAHEWPGVPKNSHALFSKAETSGYLGGIRRVK